MVLKVLLLVTPLLKIPSLRTLVLDLSEVESTIYSSGVLPSPPTLKQMGIDREVLIGISLGVVLGHLREVRQWLVTA